MALDTTDIVVISFFGVALLLIVFRWPPWLVRQVFRCLDTLPLLSRDIRQTTLTLVARTVHLLGCYALLATYVSANAFFILATNDSSQVNRRSAVACAVNLVPALLSGRTRILIESLNLSSRQQFFAHKWFARVAFLEAIVHLALVARAGVPKTIQATCGLIAFITLQLLIISSLVWLRRLHTTVFAGVHMILGVPFIFFLLCHIWLITPWTASLASRLPLTLAVLAWLMSSVHRCCRSRRCIASIHKLHTAFVVTVPLPRPVLVHPGAYFYLHFKGSGLRRFRGEAMTVFDWDPHQSSQGWARNSLYVRELSFFVEKANMPAIGNRSCDLFVEGPYGRELGLHHFSTVILAAQGAGIAAAMPQVVSIVQRYAADSAARRQMRGQPLEPQSLHRDRTSRLNLYWVLNSPAEICWIRVALKRLAAIDETKNILKIWIFDQSTELDAHVKEMDEKFRDLFVICDARWYATFKTFMAYHLNAHPGHCAVAVSGTLDFRQKISDMVLLYPNRASYFEFDYQPKEHQDEVSIVSADSESGMSTSTTAREGDGGLRGQRIIPRPPDLKLRGVSPAQGIANSRREVHIVRTQAQYRSLTGEIGAAAPV